jgi:hypothetical protein
MEYEMSSHNPRGQRASYIDSYTDPHPHPDSESLPTHPHNAPPIHTSAESAETMTNTNANTSTHLPVQQPVPPMTPQEKEEKDDYHYDDEEIQRDAANETVAMMIHIALGFFMFLFFGALVACILIVSNYGFLTFILVSTILFAALTIGYFISKMMDEDKVLKPVRRKIRRMHALATAVVVQELRDFHMDLNEHLMLTNGGDDEDVADDYGRMDDNGEVHAHQGKTQAKKKKRRGPRSKVFGFLVKPFLKKKNGEKFSFKKRKDALSVKQSDDGHSVV